MSLLVLFSVGYSSENYSVFAQYSDYTLEESLEQQRERIDQAESSPVLINEHMGIIESSRYEFSFEAPTSWRYQEGVSIDGETTYQVLMYPVEFSLENIDQEDANLVDLSTAFVGLGFQIESPLIGISFANISTSEVPRLNPNELKESVLDTIRIGTPAAKILDSYVKTEPWGWEVSVVYAFDLNLGYGSGLPYIAQENTYFFKDREAYTIFYMAHENYYDYYRPVFDHALDTLVIRGVVVPEFQEVALVVLASSIVMVVVFSRKFNFQVLK